MRRAAWASQPRLDYSQDKCIHELFEAQVELTPDAVALIFAVRQLTFRELNKRANRLAHQLRKLGVGPEVLVAICAEPSLEMVVGLLAILKAGGAYVPLDPAYPPERLTLILEDVRVPVLLAQPHLVDGLYAPEAEVVSLANDEDSVAESDDNLSSGALPDNLAYIIHTSGSTGKPKGVQGTHRGILNRFHWMWETYPFHADEVCCQKTSLNFVDSVWEVFGPLLRGIPTVVIPREVLTNFNQLVHLLAEQNVTRIVLVPSLLRALLGAGIDLQNQLPKLKYWITSGEALSVALAQRFLECMPQSRLLNLYGSSEVAADVTCFEVKSGASFTCIPIGRPISNTQIYALDHQAQLVPDGISGELHVGGDNQARGYLNDPELTATKFIPDAFGDVPGARLFKTGDLARFLPDGNIEFLGRVDNQVKIRGFRVELGEIEAALSQHPAVRETAVTLSKQMDNERLVAYVVPGPEHTPIAAELRDFLTWKLPDYMIPIEYVMLEALPFTPNGKLDRGALPAVNQLRPVASGTYVEPRTATEKIVAEIWADVLGFEQVGINDDFFELGGHSLPATQIIARLHSVFKVNLQLRSLVEKPTVAELAGLFESGSQTLASLEPELLVTIQSGGHKRPFFFVAAPHVNTLGYFSLARYMDQQQPVFLLQSNYQKQTEGEYTEAELAHLSAEYISAMRNAQPAGPYLLGGMCAGAIIAYAMARKLQAEGQPVGLLVIFDTWAMENTYSFLKFHLDYYFRRLSSLLQLNPQELMTSIPAIVAKKTKGARQKIVNRLVAVIRGSEVPKSFNPWRAAYWPEREFLPQVYEDRITLFRVNQQPFVRIHDRQLGWGSRAADVECHAIPGEHFTMLRQPHVKVVAQELNNCIRKALAETAKP